VSTPEPNFQPVEGTRFYWLDGSTSLAGFLATAAGTDPLTLSQSWADRNGLYVFLDASPDDTGTFIAALEAWQAVQPPSAGTRIAWISGTNLPSANWQVTALDVVLRDGQEVTRQRMDVDYDGMALSVSGGVGIAVASQEIAGGQTLWGLQLSGGLTAQVLAPGGAFAATNDAFLAFNTEGLGAWQFQIALAAPGNNTPSDLARLGAGMRFFSSDMAGRIEVLALEPLRQLAAAPLYVRLDPLRPYVPERCFFSFFPQDGSGTGSPPAFGSGYTTKSGYAVSLTALAGSGGTPDARLVFATAPQTVGEVGRVPVRVYLTPEGGFQPQYDAGAGAARVTGLLCGMSGLETLGLPDETDARLIFRTAGPAFAPNQLDGTANDAAEALTALGTTAWVFPGGTGGTGYFAQAEDAPFYSAGAEGFLNFYDLRTGTLPDDAPATAAFPLAPYRGLAPDATELAKRLEAAAIAPARRKAVGQFLPPEDGGDALAATTEDVATPQGLIAKVSSDGSPWPWMAIGNNTGAGEPDIRFTSIGEKFARELQTNHLFMVLGNADLFMQHASVPYQLTTTTLGMIETLPGTPVPVSVVNAVRNLPNGAGLRLYPDETAFDAMLEQAEANMPLDQKRIFQRHAGQLIARIGGWNFQLSPRNWANPERVGAENAFLVMKYTVGRSLRDLVRDIPAWGWPEVSAPTEDPVIAQRAILEIIQEAEVAVVSLLATGASAPKAEFLRIVDDPNWTGVLALSVDVPLNALPPALQPLAAGVDPALFYAHHLGLTVTPFSSAGGTISAEKTASFGLIDYQNPVDQYFSSNIPFAFRVLELTVGFENATLTSFSSKVELMINRLFGAFTRLYPSEHGNNIILDGVYQSQRQANGQTQDTYVFGMRGDSRFQLDTGALKEVQVTSTQMVTVKPPNQAAADANVTAVFQLAGALNFEEPPDFDPFCFGTPPPEIIPPGETGGPLAEAGQPESALRFSNLAITMAFSLSDPEDVRFSVADGNIAFDLAGSLPRPNSLIARFPVHLTGLMTTPDPLLSPDTKPVSAEERGFVSINAPIQQGLLGEPWYGLVYQIDLGSLGALAGSAGLSVRLLAAWSPATEDRSAAVFVGLALPGVKDALGLDLPLQGILNLGFRTIEFLASEDADGQRSYLMRLRDFGLRVLGLSFPPGHNDITLFGNPNQRSNTKLGWYAAYSNGSDGDGRSGRQSLARLDRPPRGGPEA
jgi:hypothetical protein